MALRTDLSERACTIARGVDLLGDPWVVLVLRELFTGNTRFDAIVQATTGAESVVARRLALLVEEGLVEKRPYQDGRRTRQEYALTASGVDTLPVLHALSRWSHLHTADPRYVRVICTRCGEETPSADWCPTCATALDPAQVGWYKASTPDVLTPLLPR